MGARPLLPTTSVPWFEPAVDDLPLAVLYTLAYSDVFSYPLEVDQVWRYLVGMRASRTEVRRTLSLMNGVETDGSYYYLAGRQAITETRQARAEIARQIWPRVTGYAARIARLPFVRMVALTGALAMANAPRGDDFDFLIVTEPAYMWLSRAFVIALVVRPGATRGDEVCPNYLITSDGMAFPSRDLFTAHELAQMVPLAGRGVYDRLRDHNRWVDDFLPNAGGAPDVLRGETVSGRRSVSRRLTELLLRSGVGARLDRWEMARKIPRLSADHDSTEVSFGPDHCKGHTGMHQSWVYENFMLRVRRFQHAGVS